MKKYFELFISFFKIGMFTLGGGYVMIPLIEKEVVNKRKWINNDEFTEMLTLAQSAPGAIAINTAVFVGYKIQGTKGMLATVLGTVIPSFTIILLVAIFFAELGNNETVERIFCGIRPAVVALIAVPVVNMLKNKGFKISVIIITVASAIAVWLLGISPVIVIVIAGLGSIMYNTFISKQC
ncbi:MAG: chromate transporter [Prevotellaceae bacterium]|jgi:chromate transporter|nr:chromate transporter [Prevotellaceae bacterium]